MAFTFVFSLSEAFSQDCIVLGCASNYSITTDQTLSDVAGNFGCYTYNYKRVYWQFFYSPSGGSYTQAFTPTGAASTDPSTGLSLNYIIFDVGTSAPSYSCPVDPTGWGQPICETNDYHGAEVGPGTPAVAPNKSSPQSALTTTAGHYYAVLIIVWQGSSNGYSQDYTFTIGTPQIDGTDLDASNCPGVLPVKLASFNAQVETCSVDLNWTAATEIDFKDYEVQYSQNGIDFSTIASIPSSGVSNGSGLTYSYKHNNPQQGKAYYRLKMVDIDGKFEYSKIIALNLNCSKNTATVYPNPVTNILNVNIANYENTITTAKLIDNTGKIIYSAIMANGTNSIDMSKYAKGIYLLVLQNKSEFQNIKIIK